MNGLGRQRSMAVSTKNPGSHFKHLRAVFDALDHTCLCCGTTSHSTQRGSTIIEQSGTVHCAALDELNAPSKDIQVISIHSMHNSIII